MELPSVTAIHQLFPWPAPVYLFSKLQKKWISSSHVIQYSPSREGWWAGFVSSEGLSGWQEVLNSITKCLGLCSNHKVKSQVPLSHANSHFQSILPAKCILQSCLSQNIHIAGMFHLFRYYQETLYLQYQPGQVGLSYFRARLRQHYRKWTLLFFDLFLCSYMLLYILFIYCSSAPECRAQLPQKCHHLCLYQLYFCCTNEM